MKIYRFIQDGAVRTGIAERAMLRLLPPGTTVEELLALDPDARNSFVSARIDDTASEISLNEVELLSPIEPRSLRDFITFEEHVEGMVMGIGGPGAAIPPEWYLAPTFYFTNTTAVTGPGEEIPVPPGAELMDFELEVAAIVGRSGVNLTAEEGEKVIAGYTILNDWTARDLQGREIKVYLGPCKGKDFASTLGPCIVTADELEPYRSDGRLDLNLEVWINGTKFGDDTLANMSWSFGEMVAYASRGTEVLAGDVLGSGTCGSGCLAEIWGRRGMDDAPPLKPGDEVTIVVQGIGEISNRIVARTSPLWDIPSAREPTLRRRARTSKTVLEVTNAPHPN